MKNFYQELIKNQIELNYSFSKSTNLCVKLAENCKVLGDFYNLCKECQEGFFLENNYCYKNPSSQIPFCSVYQYDSTKSSGYKCIRCTDIYWVNISGTQCSKNKLVDRCVEYGLTEAEKDTCKKCDSSYYLKNNGCEKRASVVQFCQEYEIDSEVCTKCQEGYVLTDLKKCLQEISKCEVSITLRNENDQG